MSQFQSLREYEIFIYTLPKQLPSVRYSTLVVARQGRYLAELKAELVFVNNWSGKVARNYIGTTHSLTQMPLPWPAHTLITNTFHRTSNTTVSLHQG